MALASWAASASLPPRFVKGAPMQEGVSRPRLAVLIDGENMSPRLAEAVFREVRRFGDPVVRRVYGDFKGPASGWSGMRSRVASPIRSSCRSSRSSRRSTSIRTSIAARGRT